MTAWTAANDERLRAIWGEAPAAAIAERLGYTVNSIRKRAWRLNLMQRGRRGPDWTVEDDARLRLLWASRESLAYVVSAFPGRNYNAVCGRANRIGCAARENTLKPAPGRRSHDCPSNRSPLAERAAAPKSPKPRRERVLIRPHTAEDAEVARQVAAQAAVYNAHRARFARQHSDTGIDSPSAALRPIYRPGIDPRPAKYQFGVA